MITETTIVPNIKLPENQIIDYCERWLITQFALFGSVLRNDFNEDSDIDVLVTFDPKALWSLLDLVRMQDELSKLLERKIDLIEKTAVEQSHNWIRQQEILNTAWVFYEKR